MFSLQPVLSNEYVKLEPLKVTDFEKLYKVAADPLIWEQHPTPDRYKEEVFRLFFDGAIASGSAFLITDRDTRQVIGSSRYYDYQEAFSSIAIGYTFLARSHWGGTYNLAVKRLMLDYIFQLVEKVIFHVGPQNIRSQKAVLKLGARLDRIVDFDYYGQSRPHHEYVLEKAAWVLDRTVSG